MKIILPLLAVMFLCGCTTLNVQPLKQPVKSICIVNNKRVAIPRFKNMLDFAVKSRGVHVTHEDSYDRSNDCEATMTYTARRSWDLTTYISLVDINVYETASHDLLGHLHYRIRNGLNFNKWKSQVGTLPKLIGDLKL